MRIEGGGEARVVHDTGGFVRNKDVTDRPCPTITIGVDSLNSSRFRVEGANGFNGHSSMEVSECPMPTVQAGRPVRVEGDISGQAIAEEWDKIREGETSGKYFNLTKPNREKPCPTVTGIGGNVGMASVVHPVERRKFTIAELRRICAFPDDFVLVGSYAQQWARLGNAVPPVMMMHVATAVREDILARIP